jgi:hypothetical protein
MITSVIYGDHLMLTGMCRSSGELRFAIEKRLIKRAYILMLPRNAKSARQIVLICEAEN